MKLEVIRHQWADKIRDAHSQCVQSFIQVGEYLVQAKAELNHGQFEAMVEEDLPFGTSTAQQLMAISRHPSLSNPEHVQLLPPSWGTLYQLSKLPDLDSRLSDGLITPELQRREVLAWLKPKQDSAEVITLPNSEGFVTDFSDLEGRKFQCIYADPPWKYDNQATRASTDNHYQTMTVEEICALPVMGLTAERCHLHLWTTNAFLFECPKIFAAWGFNFKSSLIWVKPQIGIGNYWRNSHEFLLLAIKGGLTAQARDLRSWVQAKRTRHSEKPGVVREVIEQLSPGPYLELFGRHKASGWTVFGDQILPHNERLKWKTG